MRHRDKNKIFSRTAGAKNAMLRDVVTSVVVFEKVQTTTAKAKAVRPLVERLVTRARIGDLASRRYLLAYFTTEQPVKKLIEVLGPRYKDRKGGYTRITKLGTRQGDSAEMAQIEFV